MSNLRLITGAGYCFEAGTDTLDPPRPGDLAKIATYLAAPDVVLGLVKGGHQARAVLDLVSALPPDQQAVVLSVPDAVPALADNGQAGAVLALVKAMSQEQQAAVLSVPRAVPGLAYNGQAGAVMALVKAMSQEHQATVLAPPDALLSLTDNGQADAVMEL